MYTDLLVRGERVCIVPGGRVDVAEAGEGGGGGQRVLALHGQHELGGNNNNK